MKFHAEGIAGSCIFARAFDALPVPSVSRIADVAALLDVSPRTVRAWLAGRPEPPRAAVIAIWHESHLGRSVTAPHSEYGAYLARAQVDTLTAELAAARATIDALSRELSEAKRTSAAPMPSNDPVFNWRNPGTRPRSGGPCTHA